MIARHSVAEGFYSGDCVGQIHRFLDGFEISVPRDLIRGGVVPHAGWVYSGRVAAEVWASVASSGPIESIVLMGAVHSHHEPDGAAVWTDGVWNSPLGSIEIDDELAHALVRESPSLLKSDRAVHLAEHSLEVQVPMIQVLMPGTKIVPIAVSSNRHACEIGKSVGQYLKEFKPATPVVASTDLTHYGRSYGFCPGGEGESGEAWMRTNDERMIELMNHKLECVWSGSRRCCDRSSQATWSGRRPCGRVHNEFPRASQLTPLHDGGRLCRSSFHQSVRSSRLSTMMRFRLRR